MQKYVLAVLFLLCGTALVNAQTPAERLQGVKTVYVALKSSDRPLGEMIRAKLISQVSKVQGLSVVEEEDDADAILTGAGLLQTGTDQFGNDHVVIHGGMRLISKQGGVVLWADDVSSSSYARSASSSFAENVAKKLAKTLAESRGSSRGR